MLKSDKGHLRPAQIQDAIVITKFLANLGLVMPEGSEDVIQHWRDLWVENPAISHFGEGVALGWVLEDDGVIKGFFGNIPQIAWYEDREILISSARAWAVASDYRSETTRLCEAFFSQTNADLLFISSASLPAGRRCEAFGAKRMPQPDYAQILYWIIDSQSFLMAAARKKGCTSVVTWAAGILGAMPLDALKRVKLNHPKGCLDQVTVRRIAEIDEDFDALWLRRRKELSHKILTNRSALTLRWYFGLSAGRGDTRILCFYRKGVLEGYAAIVFEDVSSIGLKRLKIADLFVARDDAEVIGGLIGAAYEFAMTKGCHVLELIGLPELPRSEVLRYCPFSRPMATFPFFYKALDEKLRSQLAAHKAWYITAYDGDTALI